MHLSGMANEHKSALFQKGSLLTTTKPCVEQNEVCCTLIHYSTVILNVKRQRRNAENRATNIIIVLL